MPPLGHRYGMRFNVSAFFAEEEEIAFNAGAHTEVIKLSYADFARLVQPTVLDYMTT